MNHRFLLRLGSVGTAAALILGASGGMEKALAAETAGILELPVVRTVWEQNGDYLSTRLEEPDGTPAELPEEDAVVTEESSLRGAAALPSAYSLVDEGCVTSVKDQKNTSLCWAYAALGACESNILKQGLEIPDAWKNADGELDFSEGALGWYLFTKRMVSGDLASGDWIQADGKGASGGNTKIASSAMAAGIGLQLEQNLPISNWKKGYSEYQRYASCYRMVGSDNIYKPDANTYVKEIKNWLMDTGAVEASFYSSGTFSYQADSAAYYQSAHSMDDADHAVLIVGWDDNYSRTNFKAGDQPQQDGAWLVRNSWGTEDAYAGYFWLSYEEPSVCDFSRFYMAEQDETRHCYQYDGGMPNVGISAESGANIFTAQEDGILDAVIFPNTTINSGKVKYRISLYRLKSNAKSPTDGQVLETVSGITSYNGDKYIPLNNAVTVKAGEQFSVVLTLDSYRFSKQKPYLELESKKNSGLQTDCLLQEGQSFLKYDEDSWIDIVDLRQMTNSQGAYIYQDFGNLSLKVVTKPLAEETNRTQLEQALSYGAPKNNANALYRSAYAAALALPEQASQQEIDYAAANLLAGLEREGKLTFPELQYTNTRGEPGDTDLDGSITIQDANLALLAYAACNAGSLGDLGWAQSAAADLDENGEISIQDAYRILCYYSEQMAGGTPSW